MDTPNISTSGNSSVFHPAVSSGMWHGQISARIATLTNQAITALYWNQKYSYKDLKQMLRSCPITNTALSIKALRASEALGKYTHKDGDIEKWVHGNFETMKGTLKNIVKRMVAASLHYGFAVTEIVWDESPAGYKDQWRLKNMNLIEADRIRFEGSNGEITHIVYRHNTDKIIPYNKVLHITNDIGEFGNPYGWGQGNIAFPFWKARHVLMSDWMVAAKTQAVPIWFGQANSNDTVRLLGADGRPMKNPDQSERVVSAVEALMYQLQNIENNNIVVTDLQNRLQPFFSQTGSMEFQTALSYFQKMIWLSYNLPSMMFEFENSSSLGVAGISSIMNSLFDAALESIINDLQEQMIEGLIKPLLRANFPGLDTYGEFRVDATVDPMATTQKVSNLITAVSSGVIPATDKDVINQLRSLLELPELSSSDIEQMAAIQQLQQQMQQEAAQEQPTQEG